MKEQANETFRQKAKRDKKKFRKLKEPKLSNKVIISGTRACFLTNKSETEALEFYSKRYPDMKIEFIKNYKRFEKKT